MPLFGHVCSYLCWHFIFRFMGRKNFENIVYNIFVKIILVFWGALSNIYSLPMFTICDFHLYIFAPVCCTLYNDIILISYLKHTVKLHPIRFEHVLVHNFWSKRPFSMPFKHHIRAFLERESIPMCFNIFLLFFWTALNFF